MTLAMAELGNVLYLFLNFNVADKSSEIDGNRIVEL